MGSSFGSNNTSVGSDDAKAAILTIAAAILVAGLIHPYGIFSIIAHTVMDIRQPSQLANDSETDAFCVFSHIHSPPLLKAIIDYGPFERKVVLP